MKIFKIKKIKIKNKKFVLWLYAVYCDLSWMSEVGKAWDYIMTSLRDLTEKRLTPEALGVAGEQEQLQLDPVFSRILGCLSSLNNEDFEGYLSVIRKHKLEALLYEAFLREILIPFLRNGPISYCLTVK